MDIDHCLQQAGEFGPAQKRIYYLVNLMNVVAAMQTLAPAFIASEPEWTCGSQQSSPEEQTTLQKCAAFDEGRCNPHYRSNYATIVTEWDLVCRWSYQPKLSQSAYFFGMMLGCWLLGSLAERIGRKKVYFLSIGRGWAPVMEDWSSRCTSSQWSWWARHREPTRALCVRPSIPWGLSCWRASLTSSPAGGSSLLLERFCVLPIWSLGE